MSMIGKVCAEVRNYFVQRGDIHASNFVVENGELSPVAFLKQNQYYRIVGSALNDGVYQHGVDDTELQDEDFFGAVWAMRVPKEFIELCTEIETWSTAHASELDSPYQSESFAGYSYSKGTDKNGNALTWQSQFGNKLNAFRRLSVL